MSVARGVGNLLKVAPDNPRPRALVVGSDVSSTDHKRPAGVADCLQRSENGVSAPSSEISAVLKSEPTRADFSDDADCFEVETRPLAFDAAAFCVGAADVLAGRASDDVSGEKPEIVAESICRESADIVIQDHPRIVFGIEGPAPFLALASRHRTKARAVHPEGPAAGRGTEKVQNEAAHTAGLAPPMLRLHLHGVKKLSAKRSR